MTETIHNLHITGTFPPSARNQNTDPITIKSENPNNISLKMINAIINCLNYNVPYKYSQTDESGATKIINTPIEIMPYAFINYTTTPKTKSILSSQKHIKHTQPLRILNKNKHKDLYLDGIISPIPKTDVTIIHIYKDIINDNYYVYVHDNTKHLVNLIEYVTTYLLKQSADTILDMHNQTYSTLYKLIITNENNPYDALKLVDIKHLIQVIDESENFIMTSNNIPVPTYIL